MEPNVNEVEKDDAALENEVAAAQKYLRSIKSSKKTKAKTHSSKNAEASPMTPYDLQTLIDKKNYDEDETDNIDLNYDAVKDVNVSLFIIMYKCMNSLFN